MKNSGNIVVFVINYVIISLLNIVIFMNVRDFKKCNRFT